MSENAPFWESSNDDEWDMLGTRDCEPLPPGFPQDLQSMPLQVGVSMHLVGWNCVTRAFYKEFAVSSARAALGNLLRYQATFLVYTFFSPVATPAFAVDVDWPLSRRGGPAGIERRAFSRAHDPQSTNVLFELHEDMVRPCTGRIMLRVGGRTEPDALARWHRCAKALRRVKRALQVESA